MVVYDLIPLRFPTFYGDQSLLRQRLHRGIERAAAIIAISESTKRDLVEILGVDPNKIHIIYPGVDTRFGPTKDEAELCRVLDEYRVKPPYLLYVGSLEPRKNVATLVRVFRRLRSQHRLPHQLVLCGPARWGPEVIVQAQDLIATGDCRVLDFVPTVDIAALYHGAEAFVFPSLYEGFGLPPLEAMASGVPVVASNAGSLPEVVGDSGLLVPPNDEEALEAALVHILTDSELRQMLRSRGLERAARFRWEETARQTLEVVKLACGEVS
jgi:glycosyltransferase involved in cell wall biosynthesis